MTTEKIRVYDQFRQEYDVDARNKLWPELVRRRDAGEERIELPMATITDALEWGWWSCFKTQEEWVASSGIPMPDHKLLFGLADANDAQLREYLQRFGGYVSWLEAQLGVMEGRRHALKQGYEAAVMVASAESDGKKSSEKSKEAAVLAHSETLRQTKRLQIEQETLIATAKGMLDAYQKAWETVSRVTTIRLAEGELATGRHA